MEFPGNKATIPISQEIPVSVLKESISESVFKKRYFSRNTWKSLCNISFKRRGPPSETDYCPVNILLTVLKDFERLAIKKLL